MGLKAPFPGHTLKATFDDIRRDLEGIIVRDVAGKARAGVFPDHTGELFVRQSSMKLGVKPFRAAQVRSGVVLLANEGVELVTLAAAPSANRRIDLVYVTARSTSAPWGDTADTPAFGVIQGIASATPVAPSLPPALADALPLFTVEIAAGATTTQAAGVIITQVFPYTAAAGGTVVVRNAVELEAWKPADGNTAFLVNGGSTWARRGGAWVNEGVTEFDPTFAANWTVQPGYDAKIRKDATGLCTFTTLLRGGAVAHILTVPPECRPARHTFVGSTKVNNPSTLHGSVRLLDTGVLDVPDGYFTGSANSGAFFPMDLQWRAAM